MKTSRPKRLRPAALLLLLVIPLGGWGVFCAARPDLAPAWMGRFLGRFGFPENTRPGEGSESVPESKGAASNGGDPIRGPSGGSSLFDPRALPKGLTSIDGEGGTGVNRAVKKNGVWFPVYSPGPNPGSGTPPLTVIPLSIVSGSPPPGRVNESYFYQAEAIGGTPPYHWSAVMDTARDTFTLGGEDGILTGMSPAPSTLHLDLTVTDAGGTQASAKLTVPIRPEKDLAIDTETFPVLTVGEPVVFQFLASGGVPPYRWITSPPLVNSMTIYHDGPNAGSIEGGPPGEAREDFMTAILTDSQGTRVEKSFTITVTDGLKILTPSALPPASPGQSYRGTFEAEGGTPPYRWTHEYGILPGPGWKLSEDGVLTGSGGDEAVLSTFSVMVTDATEMTFEKWFTLSVSDLLTLVPSREKVGVAWHPGAVTALLAQSGSPAAGFRVLRDGVPVYEGNGTNFVDRGLPSGSTPRYTLLAISPDGSAQPLAEKETAVLPQTLTRARPGTTGDPYADRVVTFQPLSAGGFGSGSWPLNVTGPPDGSGTFAPASRPAEVLSLHARKGAGGFIELEFTDNIVEIGAGDDLTVFENVMFIGGNSNLRFMEPAVISVALFPGEWIELPCDVIPPATGQAPDLMNPFYYARGFAGRNGTTGEDPTDPSRSGGDSLDLSAIAARAGLSWIRFIRIRSTGDQARRDDAGGDLILHTDEPGFNSLSGNASSGFDLDAVSAVHY